jgi:TP901 family phage tail tape measure protein
MFGAKSSQAILTLLGNLQDYDRTLQQVTANSGKFNEKAAAQAQETEAKWHKFLSSMQTLGVELGNSLLPAASGIAGDLGKMSAAFTRLSPSMRSTIVKVGLFVSARSCS